MTIASYEGVSALSLGLPPTTAIPAAKGELPIRAFTTRPPVSSRLRQHFSTSVDKIVMLALLRPGTIPAADGAHCHEVLVMAIGLKTPDVPEDVLEHIAAMRSSGMVFITIHQGEEGLVCTPAVRRALPTKAGHETRHTLHLGRPRPADQTSLTLVGKNMDQLWDSLCAQVTLDQTDGTDLDSRLAVRERIELLKAQEAKLTGDHSRAKTTQDRNTAFAKLQKVRAELKQLSADNQAAEAAGPSQA
ncbi:DUF4391 domain-containing protein [Bifidobacterium sp. ESL0825]|uniref:DUF4391 domain-containing protein n=1 Tax=Bifidobacterium sp. ESL0825 TaxID=3448587 RepID=UPI0040420767